MASLVEAIAAKLPPASIKFSSPVNSILRTTDGQWRIAGDDYDAVIVATPAHRAAQLLGEVDARLAEMLLHITSAGAVVVSLGYRLDQIAKPLDGFGYVVPAIEKRQVLAVSFSSIKYPDRAPAGCLLARVFIGGALQPELATLGDDELQQIAERELGEIIGARGDSLIAHVSRWQGAMPQYHVGHLNLVAQIEARTASLAGLELAGNAYRGVGVPQCIHSGETAAERIHALFSKQHE
jgi:oxygen-dependent protoporphyrinogen oxidase